MSFLTPLALLAGLLAVPIILLYMLRLRRREVVISSTFLWQQVVQDREANTPWQRLRRNLLLLLQLLILLLMVLALARPFIVVPTVSTGQTALLLDASASMNALDADGESRFEAAKRRAFEVINTLGEGSTMTVIRVGSIPEVLTPYTTDRDRLRAAVRAAQPGRGRADWLSGLTLAAAGGSGVEDFSIVLVSDGGLGEANNLPEISLPGEVRYLEVGTSGDNVAVTALATRALAGAPPQLFAQLTNYGSSEAEVVLTLRIDSDPVPFISERYTIPARSDLPVVSTRALPQDFASLEAEVTRSVNSQAEDYLQEDNTAWTVTGDTGERSVLLMTEGNLFLEQVLLSLASVDLVRIEPGRPLPVRAFDLYVFDGALPPRLPAGDMLFINPPADTAYFSVGAETEDVGTISASSDDRLTYVDFGAVNILRFREVSNIPWADVLLATDAGPLLLAGEIDGRQIGVLTFDLRQSDLPLQISWPILVSNLLEWFTPGRVIATASAYTVGDSVLMRPPLETETLRITLPDGTVEELPVERSTVIFNSTNAPGLYRIEAISGGEVVRTQHFAVNLFEPLESDIAPRAVEMGGQTVIPNQREAPGQQEFWPAILILALLMLVIEWYAYHRQIQVPTLLRRPVAAR